MKLLKSIVMGLALVLSPLALAAELPVEQTTTEQEVLVFAHVNYDDAERLAVLLNGIGEVKAQAIVDYREEHGPFEALEDLLAIKGIGEKLLEKNKDIILFDLETEV